MNLEVFSQFAKKEKGRIIGKNNTAVIYTRVSSKEQFGNKQTPPTKNSSNCELLSQSDWASKSKNVKIKKKQ